MTNLTLYQKRHSVSLILAAGIKTYTHKKSVERRSSILKWIGDDTAMEEDYDGLISQHLPKTCDWFLDRLQFRQWITPEESSVTPKVLWVHGPPGFGKTILCTRVIKHLKQNLESLMAFFFCASNNQIKQRPSSIIRSWVSQLVFQNRDALAEATNVYQAMEKRTASQKELWQLLQSICAKIPGCVLILDGFDECIRTGSGERVYTNDGRKQFLQQLVQSVSFTNSRLMIVCRDEVDIRSGLFATPFKEQCHVSEYQIVLEDVKDDIQHYSEDVVEKNLAKKSANFKGEIAKAIAERSQGMFLWIRLLGGCLTYGKTPMQLQRVVSTMPAGLDRFYDRDVERIGNLGPEEKCRAIAILRWTILAARPLTVHELTEALIVEMEDCGTRLPSGFLPDSWDKDYVDEQILGLCGALVEIRSVSPGQSLAVQTIHLAHFSIKEYLFTRSEIRLSRSLASSMEQCSSSSGISQRLA